MLGNICATARRIANPSLPFFTLAALCLIAFPLAAQQQQSGSQQPQQTGDPVADAARKAREQKKDQTKPKKVFDEDNIPKAPRNEGSAATAPSDAQAQAAAQAQGEAGAAGAAGGPGKSAEETWRARFKAQRDKIARAEKDLDLLQRELNKAQTEYYPDPQKALMEQNTRKDINEKNAKIAAKQKEIDNLKQGLSDLEDQLRKSGGDSGWARE
jgi:hypothetical protein